MGKKLDALLGRRCKTSKFKSVANQAISRLAVLKNHCHLRRSHAWSDVIQLLSQAHQQRALVRVEFVIKEQNMFDAFVMIENYCHLLIERAPLINDNRECPGELEEAISSLIFAASRCGKFPELQQIREIFESRFGKEFATRAVELGNNCRVNPIMILKLSTRKESLERKLKMLNQIASENAITLHLEEDASAITKKQQRLEPVEADLYDSNVEIGIHGWLEERTEDENFPGPMKARKKYRDLNTSMELAQSESWDEDPNDHSDSNHQEGILFDTDSDGSSKSEHQLDGGAAAEDEEDSEKGMGFDKIHPIDTFSFESEGEETAESRNNHLKYLEQSENKARKERKLSPSELESEWDKLSVYRKVFLNLHDYNEPLDEEIAFDGSDEETEKNKDTMPWLKHHDMVSYKKSYSPKREFLETRQYNALPDNIYVQHSDRNRKPILLRTRQIGRY